MDISGRTVLITGGGTGIGLGLAERFHADGAKVIIAGRRAAVLEQAAAAHPGIEIRTFDIGDTGSIAGFAADLLRDFPDLDILVNNAGIMQPEQLTVDDLTPRVADAHIAINLQGPIHLTTALLPHLRARPRAAIVNVTSGLAFVPLAIFPTYSATKAALHSYSQSLRQQLKATAVDVIELPPPYVQTELTGAHQQTDPRAMPLDAFLDEAWGLLRQDPVPDEILVERVGFQRRAEAENRYPETFATINAF